jgi:hypothetical protein
MSDYIMAGGTGTETALPPDEVRAVEGRAEVECLGDLHAQRRLVLDVLAPLKALHGPFGLFDDRRKQVAESLKIRARMTLTEQGVKVTEAAVDAHAYADPQYETLLDEAVLAKVEYLKLENQLSELNERIRSRELELSVYAAEVRLAR